VHKALLIKASEYFANALTGPWTETQSGDCRLASENVQVFKLFLQWLYTGRIEALETGDLQEFLVEAWCCGERLQAREFRNVVISMLFENWAFDDPDCPEDFGIAELAYQKSLPKSALRLLVVDKFSTHAHENMLQDVTEDVSPALLADLTLRFLTGVARASKTCTIRTPQRKRLRYDVCQRYHEHDNHFECSEQAIEASFCIHEPGHDIITRFAPFEVYSAFYAPVPR